jgi:hypothetical protein
MVVGSIFPAAINISFIGECYSFEVYTGAMGHSSSKTTEIYTHVSTKSLQQIKGPFDDL